jgi:hypothetical protein
VEAADAAGERDLPAVGRPHRCEADAELANPAVARERVELPIDT